MGKKIKVLLDFFQKIAVSKGRAFGRPPQRTKHPRRVRRETPARRSGRNPQAFQSAIRRWRNSRPMAMALAAAPTGWTVGAINQQRNPVPLSHARGCMHSPPRQGDAKRPPSATRFGVGTTALVLTPQDLRHLRMALWTTENFAPCAARVFRPLRRAGVSLAAASGYFARCDGRPKALPLETAIF